MSNPLEFQNIQTPELSNPHLSTFVATIGKGLKATEIARRPYAPIGHCYWTVDRYVKTHGGRAVQGWLIAWWPGLYMEAMHHAVWFHPEMKQIVDPTAPFPSDLRPQCSVFVEDPASQVSFDFPPGVPNKIMLLSDRPCVINYLACSARRTELFKTLNTRLAARGFQDDYYARYLTDTTAAPADPTPFVRDDDFPIIDEINRMQQEGMNHLRQINREFPG